MPWARGDAGEALDVGRAVEDGQLGRAGGRAGLAQERDEAARQGGDERDGALVAGAVGVRDAVGRQRVLARHERDRRSASPTHSVSEPEST